MQSLQKRTFFSPIFGLYAHITCKVWILHIDGMWIWCFSPVSKFCMFICLDIEAEGGGYHSQYLNMESYEGGALIHFFPEAKLSLIVSSEQTGLLCIKTICKPASLKKANTVSEYILAHSQENLVTCWIILVRHFCGILNISHTYWEEEEIQKVSKISESGFAGSEWDPLQLVLAAGGEADHK